MPDNRNKVLVNGTWRSVSEQYVKVDGSWVAATGVWVKSAGTWKQSYPYPTEADTTITGITVNGYSVAPGGTYNAAAGTSSVTIAVSTTNTSATVSGAGSVSVSYGTNPNQKDIVVTSQDGLHTQTYTIYVNVAPVTSVTIYYSYC